MRPTSGCGVPSKLVLGGGKGPGIGEAEEVAGPGPIARSHTPPSAIVVVRLPEWKIAA